MRSSTPSGIPDQAGAWVRYEDHVAAMVEAQQPASHVQNPAEIEHVAGDVSKNGAESNMSTQPAPSAARPVTPYTCPKCHALWLHWPAEQTGFGRDTLNCRSADHCHYCEKAGVEQLQRLERVPAVLSAPQPSPTPQADSQPVPVTQEDVDSAREKVLWCLGSALLSGSDREARKALDDRHTLYSLLGDANCRLVGSVAPQPSPTAQAADSVLEDAGGANWQDISTAPKDGTQFVAVGNNYGLYSETQHVCIAQWFRGRWMEVSEWNEDSELKYLTHWMPLLPLPGSAARKQGGQQGANHDNP
jgi:hypothetical protein